jgi:L-methionine (R)-S-oxide reductase
MSLSDQPSTGRRLTSLRHACLRLKRRVLPDAGLGGVATCASHPGLQIFSIFRRVSGHLPFPYSQFHFGKALPSYFLRHAKFWIDRRARYYIVLAMPHKYLLKEFEEFARSAAEPSAMMQRVSQRIHMHIPRYNWVGFYLVDPKDPSMLVLGPHTGSFAPKPKISWSEGLCGSAAAGRRMVVSDNVAEDPRYIQASDLVKSQISAPVLSGARVLGVFNVESYFMATFKPALERDFVVACTRIVAKCFARTLSPDLVNV